MLMLFVATAEDWEGENKKKKAAGLVQLYYMGIWIDWLYQDYLQFFFGNHKVSHIYAVLKN